MLHNHSKNSLNLEEKETDEAIKRRKIISIISLIILILFSVLIAYYIGRPMLKLVKDPDGFEAWVDSHGFNGRILFLGMQVLQVIIAIIPGEPLEIGAGIAFGAFEGTLLCVLGNLIGGVIIFAIVRKWGIKFVELFFSREKLLSLKFLNSDRKVNMLIYVLFLLPGTPKDLLSYFAGLTNISWSKWIFVTSIARLPSIVTSTIGGGALSKGNYERAILIFIISAALSFLGLLIFNAVSKHHNKKLKEKSDIAKK